jgi:hypothetical protein
MLCVYVNQIQAEERRRLKEESAAGEGEVVAMAAASASSTSEEENDGDDKEQQEGVMSGIALDFGREYMESALWELEWLPYTIRQALARSPGEILILRLWDLDWVSMYIHRN